MMHYKYNIKALLVSSNLKLISEMQLFFSKIEQVELYVENSLNPSNNFNMHFLILDAKICHSSSYSVSLLSVIQSFNNARGRFQRNCVLILLNDEDAPEKDKMYYANNVLAIVDRNLYMDESKMYSLYYQILSFHRYIFASNATYYEIQDLRVDLINRVVLINNVLLDDISQTEFIILHKLCLHVNNPVSKEDLMGLIKKDVKNRRKTIEVFIYNLRNKMARHSNKVYIRTLWGRGYIISSH